MNQAALVYENSLLLYENGKFERIPLKNASKYRVGALINSKSLIAMTMKLPLSLTKEQLDIQVELKMYQEGGLDANRDYVVDYVAFPVQHENNYLIEAYAVEQKLLTDNFGDIAKKTGFIDIIFPRFLIYKALYVAHSSPSQTDLFVHIGESEAYGTLYKDGEYVAFRSIESLSELSKKCGIEIAKLKEYLSQKGLKMENYAPEEMNIFDVLQERFYKNMEKIVYAINYKRSYFGIDQIDNVYLDFDGGEIDGLEALLIAAGLQGEANVKPLQYQGLEPKESALLLAIEYIGTYNEQDQVLNFTIFERKKPIYTYRSLQVGALLLLLVLLYGAGAGYLEYQKMQYEEILQQKKAQLARVRKKNRALMTQLKKIQQQKRKALKKKELALAQKELAQLTLDAIPMIEASKQERQKMMNDIVEALYKYRLTTKDIDQNGTTSIKVDLVSKYDQRQKIGKFINYLLQKGYKNITTKEITREENFYESLVEVRQ